MPEPLSSLVQSRKFWIAVFALVQSIVFAFLPNFPPAVWQAIDGLAAVLIAAIACEDVAERGLRAATRIARSIERRAERDDVPR